ncbi:hypothetical protein D3C87_1531850 [compost metagenome]
MLQTLPAARRVVLESLCVAWRRRDPPVVPDRRLGIPWHIQRRHRLLDEAAVLFQDGIHQVGRHFFEAGQFQDIFQPGQFLQGKAEVLQRGYIGHDVSLTQVIRQRHDDRPQHRQEHVGYGIGDCIAQ